MKFLSKNTGSAILAEGICYDRNGHNTRLRDMLLAEQCGFCAYTEKRVDGLDSVDVEHFDKTKKGDDDYFNYYAVLHGANLRKRGKEERHAGAAFFASLFFQDRDELNSRIRYVAGDGVYEETTAGDDEAAALIDFLGFNDSCLCEERIRHIKMLRDIFEDDAKYDEQKRRDWFTAHPEHLCFVTAVEEELGIDLSAMPW
ncbi:MAG: hypothetical protein PHU25_04565 [Deltaproteobacteria bacterium]|nr:hypothetical protein [Deltaproteobacteria bacterium]